eukprot:2756398-Rhodomonas_salina.2
MPSAGFIQVASVLACCPSGKKRELESAWLLLCAVVSVDLGTGDVPDGTRSHPMPALPSNSGWLDVDTVGRGFSDSDDGPGRSIGYGTQLLLNFGYI